jgi:hypothetical protein
LTHFCLYFGTEGVFFQAFLINKINIFPIHVNKETDEN